jgi:D-methionine transport system ATP-binding protein
MEHIEPIIRLNHLSKTFKSKDSVVNALDDISLEIQKGEIFGIIGMSGAGKSTLVRCINLLEKPTAGSVLFDGQDLLKLNQKELRESRQSMGMIFQQFNLLMQRTALKNICFPLELSGMPGEQAHKRATELLDIVGLSDKADAYPSQLSGGQKQRVAIARALATNPKVLLCDEATSALDPATTHSILSLIKKLNKQLGITIVIITHEMSVIQEICQRVAIIDASRIVEIGTVEEIFSSPKSTAGKKFIYPNSSKTQHFERNRCIRVVFDGDFTYEPIIANMILDCKELINILFADIKNIDNKAYGHLVLQIPDDDIAADKIIKYFKMKKLSVEEVVSGV